MIQAAPLHSCPNSKGCDLRLGSVHRLYFGERMYRKLVHKFYFVHGTSCENNLDYRRNEKVNETEARKKNPSKQKQKQIKEHIFGSDWI